MGQILRDWDLEEKKALSGKAYDDLPEGVAFIILESLIDDERRNNALGLLMSLNMLIELSGGFDYTAWLQEAGFRKTRVEPPTGPDSMVVGIKNGHPPTSVYQRLFTFLYLHSKTCTTSSLIY
jgi:hypothetical protein